MRADQVARHPHGVGEAAQRRRVPDHRRGRRPRRQPAPAPGCISAVTAPGCGAPCPRAATIHSLSTAAAAQPQGLHSGCPSTDPHSARSDKGGDSWLIAATAGRRTGRPRVCPAQPRRRREPARGAAAVARDASGRGRARWGRRLLQAGPPAHLRRDPGDGHGEPVDVVTVADELRRDGLLDEIGGPRPAVELQNATPAISNASRYAKIVQDTAMLRRLIGVASEIAEIGYHEPDDVTKALDEAETKVFEVAQHRVADSTAAPRLLPLAWTTSRRSTSAAQHHRHADRLRRSRRDPVGLQPSTLDIVGARPAMGKCVACGHRAARPGHRRAGHRGRAPPAGHGRGVGAGRLARPSRRPPAWWPRRRRSSTTASSRCTGSAPASGRIVRTTLSHPFLTEQGWRPLGAAAPQAIASRCRAGCRGSAPSRLHEQRGCRAGPRPRRRRAASPR